MFKLLRIISSILFIWYINELQIEYMRIELLENHYPIIMIFRGIVHFIIVWITWINWPKIHNFIFNTNDFKKIK